MDIKSLIPKDKLDIDTAEKLFNFSYQEIKPIVPELLEWIKDMNWPVAHPIAEYLVTICENITPEIMQILSGNDEIWKYWCIGVFGIFSNKILDDKIYKILCKIAHQPNETELEHEVNKLALEAIKRHEYKCS